MMDPKKSKSGTRPSVPQSDELQQALIRIENLRKSLAAEPHNSQILLNLGMLELQVSGNCKDSTLAQHIADLAVRRLTLAMGVFARPKVPVDSETGFQVASRIGFYHSTRFNFEEATKWLRVANDSKFSHNQGARVLLATMLPRFPHTIEEEKKYIKQYHRKMDALLALPTLNIDSLGWIDSAFWHAYYDQDHKAALIKHAQLWYKAVPALRHTAPHLKNRPPRQGARLKLGCISSFFRSHSSIMESLRPTLERLPAHLFEIIYIYYPRDEISDADKSLSSHPERDIYLPHMGNQLQNANEGRTMIEQADLDILLYLDLFMTPEMHQLALTKVAPIQAVTHGHPVTSGIPRSTMDYYFSWAAAELPDAQNHYTEELVLLPAQVPWEFWEPRNTPDCKSLLDDMPWGHFRRTNVSFVPNHSAIQHLHWYFCAQATFKFHCTFDAMLADILRRDPQVTKLAIKYR
jgi:predicted O-linked N-acetylglucosamine transferase (SPINDLY family)